MKKNNLNLGFFRKNLFIFLIAVFLVGGFFIPFNSVFACVTGGGAPGMPGSHGTGVDQPGGTSSTCTITASSGSNGTINPASITTVVLGGDQTYTITPDSGYSINTITVDGVGIASSNTYTFTNVIADHTIDVTFVSSLVLAKANAHSDIDVAFLTYHQSDYTSTNWAILINFRTMGDMAVDNALDLVDVSVARTTAINNMAGVQTIAQTTALELTAAKAAAVTELAAYKNPSDYRSAEQTTLANAIIAGNSAINGAANISAVATALSNAKAVIDAIKTDAQLTSEELTAAKAAAHTALNTTLATYTQSNYTSANWATLTGFKTAGDTAIDTALDTAGVTSAQNTATTGMAGVAKIDNTGGTTGGTTGGNTGGNNNNTTSGGGGGAPTPIKISTIIPGCGNRTTGFSTLTGKSCIGNKGTILETTGQVLGAQKFIFTLLLKKGSIGNEVLELQKFLNNLKYDCGIPDGKFGLKTKLAVMKFQTANKLKADGIVGKAVRAILNK